MLQSILVTIITAAIALTNVLPVTTLQLPAPPAVNAAQEPPTTRVVPGRRPPSCEFYGPVIRIPSRSGNGVQVRVSSPARARYPEGAPIVVHSSAAPNLGRVEGCFSGQGFVEVDFICPEESIGASRVSACSEALADVLGFATGQIRSMEDKSIGAYTGNIKPDTANVGVVGWSAGGNRAILAMARYGDRFPNLKWFASWESPVLSPVDIGAGSIFQPNPYYDSRTGTVEFNRLRYSAEMPLWVWPLLRLPREATWPRGGLYLDGDGNGAFNKDADYAFWVIYDSPSVGQPRKAFYTPEVTREARNRQVFGPTWPSHIATVQEVEERASSEDPLQHIRAAVRRLPHVAVLVFESEIGHVGVSADHPHAIAHVNAWLSAGVRWVRFNPDAHYVENIMAKRPARIVQNPAGKGLERAIIAGLLEPGEADGGPSDAQGMAAAVGELADRTYRNNWTAVLTTVLVN